MSFSFLVSLLLQLKILHAFPLFGGGSLDTDWTIFRPALETFPRQHMAFTAFII